MADETKDQGLAKVIARANAANAENSDSGRVPDTADAEEIVVIAPKLRDHRVRISAFSGQESEVYGPPEPSNLMFPLHNTGGLMFPYTPQISVSQDTTYSSAELEQSIYDILSFQKSSSANISLQARFTVQNQREGEYLMAVLHFLRTVSKTYFGKSDANIFADPANTTNDETIRKVREDGKAGLPPPVLVFSGYGEYLFNSIHVVVKSYSYSFDENVDMVPVILRNQERVYLPPVLSISIGLAIQTNPNDLREEFSLADFRTGRLLSGRKGWF